MDEEVRIERFRLSDRESLMTFLSFAYPNEPSKSDIAVWNWHYLEHPLVSPADMPLWVVKDGNRIVGQLATIPVELKVGTDITAAIWILDFIVLPKYRGKGLGSRLVQAAGESFGTMITLGINEQSTAVFNKLKWRALGGVIRYQKILFPGRAIREVSRIALLRKLVDLTYAPFRPKVRRRDRIREITRFTADFDDLWLRAGPQWPCAVVRSSDYLEWQFHLQPDKRFEVFGCFDDDRLRGYIVVFFRKVSESGYVAKAAISDICYDDPEVIAELLEAAISLAIERGAGSLVTDILDPLLQSQLRQFGFWRIKKSPRFMASTTEFPDLVYNEAAWFLTRGDSDVSIFEQPNK